MMYCSVPIQSKEKVFTFQCLNVRIRSLKFQYLFCEKKMKSRNVDIIYFTNKSNCILCIMAVNCHLQESMSVRIRWNGISMHAANTNLFDIFTVKMQK